MIVIMITQLKISLVLAPLALLLVIGVYIYSLWAAERQKTSDLPVEAIGKMMSDLLKFHEKRGGFPDDLKQMEGVVWEKKDTREFSIGNRGFSHRQYFYLYTQITSHQFTLWAIPTGKMREEAPTWFILVTPSTCRRWKGPALDLDQVSQIRSVRSMTELSVLGLIEQESIDFKDTSIRTNGYRPTGNFPLFEARR